MIQRSCPGVGVGVHILAWKGRLLSAVQQRRLHEPLHGGGKLSHHRAARSNARNVCATIRRGLRLEWRRHARIQARSPHESYVADGSERTILGVFAAHNSAGLDYPFWLVRLYLEGPDASPFPLPCAEAPRPTASFATRRRMGGASRGSTAKSPWRVARWTREFRHVIDRSEAWDTERADDPIPAIAEWWQDAGRMMYLFGFESANHCENYASISRRRRGLRVLDQVRGRAPRVLFVVHRGKHPRSPFAEHYMRQRLGYAEVRSVGTLQFSNRLVPETVEHVARERFGVDLLLTDRRSFARVNRMGGHHLGHGPREPRRALRAGHVENAHAPAG